MRYPLAELRLCTGELSLQHRDPTARRMDVGRDAQRTYAESAGFPGRTHRSRDSHHGRGVHTDGEEEVLCGMLRGSGSHRVLDDERIDVERPRHGRGRREEETSALG